MNNNVFNANNGFFAPPPMHIIAQGFCYANPDMLAAIKAYFGLEADLNFLFQVQRHFAMIERREPYADELRFIDKAYMLGARSPSDLFLAELISNDLEAGAAYDDIRLKFNETDKDPRSVYSIADILTAGDTFLGKLGKDKPDSAKMISGSGAFIDAGFNGADDAFTVSSEIGGHCTVFSRQHSIKRPSTPLELDRIIFTVSKDPEMTQNDFSKTLATAVNSPYVKYSKELSNMGALWAVLEKVNGAAIDISELMSSFYGFDASSLLINMKNSAITIVSGTIIDDFFAYTEQNNLASFIIGKPYDAKRVTIRSGLGAPISLSSKFLAGIPHFKSFSAKISKQAKKTKSEHTFFVDGEKREYLASKNAKMVTNITSSGDFTDSALTLLEGVCRLVGAGVPRKDIIASFYSGANATTPDKAGETMSQLLGLYRTQSELALPSDGSTAEFADSPFVSITLLAEKPQQMIPSKFEASGSRVYLLSPRYSASGLPEFKDVRLLLSYIEELSADEKIISARALGKAGALESIKLMNSDSAVLKNIRECEKAARGSFIIETNFEISGFFLGFTE